MLGSFLKLPREQNRLTLIEVFLIFTTLDTISRKNIESIYNYYCRLYSVLAQRQPHYSVHGVKVEFIKILQPTLLLF